MASASQCPYTSHPTLCRSSENMHLLLSVLSWPVFPARVLRPSASHSILTSSLLGPPGALVRTLASNSTLAALVRSLDFQPSPAAAVNAAQWSASLAAMPQLELLSVSSYIPLVQTLPISPRLNSFCLYDDGGNLELACLRWLARQPQLVEVIFHCPIVDSIVLPRGFPRLQSIAAVPGDAALLVRAFHAQVVHLAFTHDLRADFFFPLIEIRQSLPPLVTLRLGVHQFRIFLDGQRPLAYAHACCARPAWRVAGRSRVIRLSLIHSAIHTPDTDDYLLEDEPSTGAGSIPILHETSEPQADGRVRLSTAIQLEPEESILPGPLPLLPDLPRSTIQLSSILITVDTKKIRCNMLANNATRPGECALLCPACPHPGINLPENWADYPEEKQFLFALFLAIDANFRLRRKDISSEAKDPGLGDGMSFFCDVLRYMEHVQKHWNDRQARSRCVAHDAVDKPDREARGTASSGIGAVDCARHNMKRPLSVGDTQLGERYINMDYMFFRSIVGSDLVRFFVSYDIACQWHVHIWERMRRYENELLTVDENNKYFVFLVPGSTYPPTSRSAIFASPSSSPALSE
ncbi:hypothetical protein HMN09_01423700 [Mycena chlorophos]|uniref:CxC2-like cysteine cluster KDZ transposase-associated domain-containing protein n=1 Tax=Mycena chlorophos TaxID=658473 RepID=A0A8H6RYT3_MYCCL|nr:hypothetical protein HMN09_01423700 [Mycena chlorophos]